MGTLVATATIRHARLAAEKFDFPLCWCGLPRTISGFAALSFPLSHDVLRREPLALPDRRGRGHPLCLLKLVPIPYMTHRGQRAMQP